ncbi:competence protein ComER [Tumebacillus sp. BK434]|uniref:late competence protein ComER n=1 Tax=Tumebacillus sp. BK434 TaxID=2512169 RepID=UPI00104967E2|nr:late competence protein ComER [Tumebacillus sp. BK434]TCP55835.1 competence protein ComER [Tumebacillus sp. BK434]
MRIGFIGTGSMGGMLVRAFLQSTPSSELQVVACNRSPEKLAQLTSRFPQIETAASPEETVSRSDIVFLCVKPGDAKGVIQQVLPYIRENHYFISINSAVMLDEMEAVLPCRVSKVIPSITQVGLSGVTLAMHGSRMCAEEQRYIESWLAKISKPIAVEENDLRVCSDLSSCGPAFLAVMLREFAMAAVRQGGIPRDLAESLVKEMTQGVGKLLTEEGFEFEDIIKRVAVPGGITAEGIKVLHPSLHGVFDQLLVTTRSKSKHHGSSAPESK